MEEEQKENSQLPQLPSIPDAPRLKPIEPGPTHPAHVPPVPRLERVRPRSLKMPAQPGDDRQVYKSALAYSIGSTLVGPMVVFSLIGYWLDKKFMHPTPWCTIAGFVVGVITAAGGLVSIVRRLQK